MGSSYSVEVAAMNAMMGFIVMIVFVCLAGVAAQVLLGLATYNDAKARGNNDPVMWGLLVGFLGWIPGIVYLCLRNNNANRLMTLPAVWVCTPGGGAVLPAVPRAESIQRAVSEPTHAAAGAPRKTAVDLGGCGLCCGDRADPCRRLWADDVPGRVGHVLTLSFKRETGRSPAGMKKIGTGRTIYVTGDGPDKDL